MSIDFKIAVYGLGYVGLPLALKFGEKFDTIGFDIDKKRIDKLKEFEDLNGEISKKEFYNATRLKFSYNLTDIKNCNFFIITLPTPVDNKNTPDLSFLKKGTIEISKILKKKDIVVYESTVFPGCTEEEMVPILENSGLKYNVDFFCGYSPERINPGDKTKSVSDIVKITSGSNHEIAEIIDKVYSKIITAGTYKTNSIKVAEAAKVIENIQRDINIALVNELSIIFNKMHLDTEDVLKAAETKWNFQSFRPGLVGGHCIGVDPYYLTYKSKKMGYNPKFILSGRNINDNMGFYVLSQLIENMKRKDIKILNANILIIGLTFKENCSDIRNSKVFQIISSLLDLGIKIEIYDPWVKAEDLKKNIKHLLVTKPKKNYYDALLISVAHEHFKNNLKFKQFVKKKSVIYDLKYLMPKSESDIRL